MVTVQGLFPLEKSTKMPKNWSKSQNYASNPESRNALPGKNTLTSDSGLKLWPISMVLTLCPFLRGMESGHIFTGLRIFFTSGIDIREKWNREWHSLWNLCCQKEPEKWEFSKMIGQQWLLITPELLKLNIQFWSLKAAVKFLLLLNKSWKLKTFSGKWMWVSPVAFEVSSFCGLCICFRN